MPDTQIAELPRWLVRHICYPENHRLPKQPSGWYHSTPRQDVFAHMLPSVYQPTPLKPLVSIVRHLDNNDYRLWSEIRIEAWTERVWDRTANQYVSSNRPKLIQARCRWCYDKYDIKDFVGYARKSHKNVCPFTANLRAIFDIIRDAKKCVQCDKRTSTEHWGLPICSEACQEAWVTQSYPSVAMRDATTLARRAGKIVQGRLGTTP